MVTERKNIQNVISTHAEKFKGRMNEDFPSKGKKESKICIMIDQSTVIITVYCYTFKEKLEK